MRTAAIALASVFAMLCGTALFVWLSAERRESAPASLAHPDGGAAPPALQSGHGQKWENLPFRPSTENTVPAARTPGGERLTVAHVVGTYCFSTGFTGSSIRIRMDGSCTMKSFSCIDSGSSEGLVRIVDDRIEIESLSLAGRPTGRKCLCVPVWWKGRVYLLGSSGDRMAGGLAEFCNAVNWGEEPSNFMDFHNLEGFYAESELRGGDEMTSIPAAIAPWILRTGIEGRMIESSDNELRVNLGTRDGVFVGQRLQAVPESGESTWLRVKAVGQDSCAVGLYFAWHDRDLLTVGTRVHSEAKGTEAMMPK